MRKLSLCSCGSGKDETDCCNQKLQVKVRKIPINSDKERTEIIRNIEISSQFNMRYRGLFEYYGKDFIEFKLEKPRDQNRNEFLRLISTYMAHHLEDSCPSSWEECPLSFWEELIITLYPLHMKVTPQQKEVEKFLIQLTIFARWLDKNRQTSLFPVIEKFKKEYRSELEDCEKVLNALYSKHFPSLHESGSSNAEQEMRAIINNIERFSDTKESLFEVTGQLENMIVLNDLDSKQNFYVKGLPSKLIKTGLLLNGTIGKIRGEMSWNWCLTEGVYPYNAQHYFVMV
jgi:hypothetical protein